jgi:ubiquinone/menaquinone biosynthesis C-methylase UbiE
VIEFTGERVIPGEVNDDLWAEHLARYAFANRYAQGVSVLDIGCGAGYGTAELAKIAHRVTGADTSLDALRYARDHYTAPNVQFLQASATALPFPDFSFDLAAAFEVIEHVDNFRAMLTEAHRVLRSNGVLLVSTPNRLYYAESRAEHGPNPFHTHEFEFAEFEEALRELFPNVTILLQNRIESIGFYPTTEPLPRADTRIDRTSRSAEEAHFFVAVCAKTTAPALRGFVYIPRASNILRERERHIHLLETELDKNKQWLAEITAERAQLLYLHAEQTRHLEEQNRWAAEADRQRVAALERISQLQDELRAEQTAAAEVAAGYAAAIADLEKDNAEKTQWALDTEARLSKEIASKCAELAEAVRLLDAAEATVIERTRWAEQLRVETEQLDARLRMIRNSRWIRLGRTFGVGPQVSE